MNIRIWKALAILGLALSQPAVADNETLVLVNAVETSPSNIILPASTNGMMSFKPCDKGCDEEYERARITEGTRFVVDGKAVNFEDFRNAFAVIRGNDDSYALVSYDTKTKTVTSIDVAP
ncbi:MAG: hypothetical protein OER22_09055 [Gammaproteobacteria bacterium]|nr:hypothetical protein [Gammaproteobacteria bacterium]MDH3374328.1 hypothetical protein [Gammaproteobacteria bacterium]MDH3408107.1 hypothetical protein [Gammaproteobacteria bacterium]MDH3552746.1 hypothetical protein [Gammaproteobacteria bacterium]